MSADLWAAFAGTTDDLSSNPWSQSSPTQIESATQREKTATQVQSNHSEAASSSSEQPQTPWASTISPIYKPPAPASNLTADPWRQFEGSKEDAWSGWESPSVSADAWTNLNVSSGVLGHTSHKTEGFASTDDWGDFEAPEEVLSQSVTGLSPKDRPERASQSPKVNPVGTTYSDRLSEAAQQRSNSSAHYETYPSVESANKLERTAEIDIKHVKAIQPPSFRSERGPAPANQTIPYEEEEWGEFSPDPVTSPSFSNTAIIKATKSTTKPIAGIKQSAQQGQVAPTRPTAAEQRARSQVETASTMPPTNVPPPSILISLVSSLVEKLPTQVESAMRSFTQSGGSDKALEVALRKCIGSLKVAARVAAGRKVRWKRDTHLAQSMRIGQAGKGMKLSGVDKSEVKREDREAAEFVQVWQKRLGSIRKALALVNSQISGSPLALPDISETMLIRTIKPADGGIPAPKCCVICGIKREERVDKVDMNVFDAFAEWWTDHWGHTDYIQQNVK